jgi:hypothetical protein
MQLLLAQNSLPTAYLATKYAKIENSFFAILALGIWHTINDPIPVTSLFQALKIPCSRRRFGQVVLI